MPTVQPSLWLESVDATTIHAQIHEGLISVPLVVNGRHATFLLDSAGSTAVDPQLAPQANAPAVVLRTLQIGALRLTGVSADRLPVRRYAKTYFGVDADGILGRELFGGFPVAIDYENSVVIVYRTSAAAAGARPAGAITLALRAPYRIPYVDAVVNRQTSMAFAVETASALAVTIGLGTARSRGLLSTAYALAELRAAQPVGELFGKTGRLRSLALSSIMFVKPLVAFVDEDDADGVAGTMRLGLGAPMLSQFALVIIDEPGGLFAIFSGQNPLPPPDYDRSGAWLVDRDGSVVVRSVLGGSPAAVAGLVSGDEIVELNGNPLDDLESARSLLKGGAGTKVTVTYRRGGLLRHASIVLRTLL